MSTRILAALALVAVLGASARAAADDPKLPDVKAFDKLVIDTLRAVHDKGADLYNTSKDFAGAYRVYQGALETVRPLLAHRPEAQKIIDTGLAAAEKETDAARKAIRLHETIEATRKNLKLANGLAKPMDPPEKKPDDKKSTDVKKPEPLPVAPMPKDVKPKANPTAAVSGLVTVNGTPIAKGEVAFTSVGANPPVTAKAKINDDGSYKFAEKLPPGKYVITVTGAGVPAKYKSAETSGLVVDLKSGSQIHDIELK